MSRLSQIRKRVKGLEALKPVVDDWKSRNHRVVFTNGCFDILHRGHVEYLAQAADLGDRLVIGVNTDASVKRQGKGPSRPLQDEQARSTILASLDVVDAVILFDEDTPLKLISALLPDVLVKGGDYAIEDIVGYSEVMANGGEVRTIPLVKGYSTTSIEEKIKTSL